MKRMIGMFVLIMLYTIGTGQTNVSPTLTLKQAVETALVNNLDVKQRDLQMQSAEANWKQSKSDRFPTLAGVANHGSNQGRSIDPFTNSFINQTVNYASYGLNSGVTLFNGLGIWNNIKANALGYAAAKWELEQEKDNLTLNVILAYLQLLTNTDLLERTRNTTTVTRKQLDRLEIMNKQGAIAPALLFDLRGQLASDEVALIDNVNALNASRLLLSQLMNVPFSTELMVERLPIDQFNTEYPATVEDIYTIALQKLSVIKATSLRTQSAEKALKAAKGDFYPSLGLSGQITTNYSNAAFRDILINTTEGPTDNYVVVNGTKTPVIATQNNFSSEKIKFNDQLDNNLFTSINLGLRIPLFNNLVTRTRVRQAEITRKSFENIEQTTKIQLKQNIEQAYFNMIAARDRYKALLEQFNAFGESFRAAEVRFAAGASTSVEYIIAKNNVDRVNSNLISARYDYLLRTKILDYYQGKPLW
ncbi:MAG TPA: TolC family protein [Flavitalea sp.]|nr:TolC family protein [Flavitalea sp.]